MDSNWWSGEASGRLALVLSLGGPFVGALAWCAASGLYRRPVMAVYVAVIALYGIAAGTGIIAFLEGQPPHIWVTLTVTGITLTTVLWYILPTMRSSFDRAELRRTVARDL